MQSLDLIMQKRTSQITLKSMLAAGGLLISGLFLMPQSLNGQEVAGAPEYYQTRPSPHFKPNKGQVADHEGNLIKAYKYVYQAPGMKVGLTQNGFHYNLYTVEEKPRADKKVSEATGKPAKAEQQPERPSDKEAAKQRTYHYHRVEVEFKGANEDPEIVAEDKMDYYANYYLGYLPEYVTQVHGYRKLTYKNLYDNIDLVLRPATAEKGRPKLKYNIRVRPGGDLSDVKLVYKGMDKLSLEDGKLQIATSQGRMTETIPKSYWAESKEATTVNYQLEGNTVSFQAEQQQEGQTLVVDPSLSWSTYLGGGNADGSEGVTTDGNGNVYVTGRAESGFPTTSGAYQPSYTPGGDESYSDAFLTKFTSKGNLTWSTYLGGSNTDQGNAVTTDGNGNVYVTGSTESSDFPTTSGAYQPSYGGGGGIGLGLGDAFLTKFTNKGNLRWSTYVGGSNREAGYDLTSDRSSGNVYVTGNAESGFPTTSGAYQPSYGGESGQLETDAFLTKFTSEGNLIWSTYLGGSKGEFGSAVTTGPNGNVYVTGQTLSYGFPTTGEAYQRSLDSSYDAFLTKFNSNGNLTWSTYLGGSEAEYGYAVTTDESFNVYVTGYAQFGYPTTAGSYQDSNKGFDDAFLTKFNFPKPKAGFIPDSGCFSDSLRFVDTSLIKSSGSIAQYTWRFGDGSTDSGKTVFHVYDSSGTYTVQLVVTTTGGMTDTAKRKAVAVGPSAGFTINEPTQCRKGNRFKFTDQSTSNNGGLSYSWAFGNGDSSSAKSPAYTYQKGGKYIVKLEVTNQAGCKDTSKQSVQVYGKPEPVSIIRATTTTDSRNQLRWQPSDNSIPRSYQIQRAEDQEPFRDLATVQPNQGSYMDAEVSVDSHTYQYRVQLIDSCGNAGPFSKPHQPIQLQAEAGKGNPKLSWTAYQGWSVSSQQVQIESLNGPGFEVIPPYSLVVPDRRKLTDSLSDLEAGQLCYRIVALKAGGGSETIKTTSNVQCIDPKIRLYAPDAFSPNGDGYNDKFLVKGTYISDLTMRIYNRWGEEVYEGSGMEASWDGTYNGQQAPEGPYTYLIIAEGADGDFVQRSGTLKLLR